jgi:hypothetical protein
MVKQMLLFKNVLIWMFVNLVEAVWFSQCDLNSFNENHAKERIITFVVNFINNKRNTICDS